MDSAPVVQDVLADADLAFVVTDVDGDPGLSVQ
jgi:hypothetical protein